MDLRSNHHSDAVTTSSPVRSVVVPSALNPYVQAATSDNTRRAYQAAVKRFERWGGRLPASRDTITAYLLAHAEQLNPRTLAVHLTAFSQWHRLQGLADPTADPVVRKTLEGILRVHGRPKRKAKALRLDHLAAMLTWLAQQQDSHKQRRDRALILVGYFGAFRRSELCAITVADLHWEPEGVIVQLPKSKTDQTGQGLFRALPHGEADVCPVAALRAWLNAGGISEGSVFRAVNRWDQVQATPLADGSVNDILKAIGTACGFEFVPELSSHSFRRGFSTTAAREKISFDLIKQQGGWKNDATVWEYIDEGQRLTDNATLTLMTKLAALLESSLPAEQES